MGVSNVSMKKREKLLATLAKRNPYINNAILQSESRSKRKTKGKEENIDTRVKEQDTKSMKKAKVDVTNKSLEKVGKEEKGSQSLQLIEAIKDHDAGIKGDKIAVKKAYTMLKKLYSEQKANLEIRAYLGSAATLLGRDAHSVTDKMKYALEGLKHLDEVVEKKSDFFLARFLRGHVAYRLPDMYFQRMTTAIEDFTYIVNEYDQNAKLLTEEEYVEILKNLVDLFKRTNDLEKSSFYQEKLKQLKKATQPLVAIANDEKQEKQYQGSDLENEGMNEEASEFYERALKGTSEDVKKAISFFEVFVLTNSAPEVEMYLIDLQSMQARDSINTYEMFGSAIKSMKAMDSLIQEHPENLELKIIRARHSLRLPELFFRRAAIAMRDIESLLKDEGFLKQKGDETKYQLMYELGLAYEMLDMTEEALGAWNQLSKLRPGSYWQAKIDEKKDVYSYKEIDLRTLTVATPEKLYEKAKEMHKYGAKGSKVAARQSLKAWEKAKEANPECEIAATYYAASVALQGRFASDPQDMFKDTIQGLKLLKTCITTDNPELKFLRGMIYSAMPEGFFHTSDKAMKDLKSVKAAYEQEGENCSITREQYLQLLYELGLLYQRNSFHDKAEKTWKQLLKEEPNSPYAMRLESMDLTD